jgi:HPt (histidine-containing phosphotransfer) domain-containing protein
MMNTLDQDDSIRSIQIKFLDGLPERIKSISDAHKVTNWKEIDSIGHKLKGTASSLQFKGLAELGW